MNLSCYMLQHQNVALTAQYLSNLKHVAVSCLQPQRLRACMHNKQSQHLNLEGHSRKSLTKLLILPQSTQANLRNAHTTTPPKTSNISNKQTTSKPRAIPRPKLPAQRPGRKLSSVQAQTQTRLALRDRRTQKPSFFCRILELVRAKACRDDGLLIRRASPTIAVDPPNFFSRRCLEMIWCGVADNTYVCMGGLKESLGGLTVFGLWTWYGIETFRRA